MSMVKSARANRNSVFTGTSNAAIAALRAKIKSLDRSSDSQPDFDPYTYGVEVVPEQIIIFGKSKLVRRAYLIENKYKIGWVVDCDLHNCMICWKEFGWYRGRPKHHCRACGALVCGDCSPFITVIPVLNEDKGSRVCTNCFGLKSPIASQLRMATEPETPAINLFNSPIPNHNPNFKTPATNGIATNNNVNSSNNSVATNPITRKKSIKMENEEKIMQKYLDEMEKLDQQQLPKYEEAYRKMREIIPLDIYKSKASRLSRRGIPEECIKRIWNTKILWLIVTHPDDIKKVASACSFAFAFS